MMCFILCLTDGTTPYWLTLWYDNATPDTADSVAEEARKRCAEMGRSYVSQWSLDLPGALLPKCQALHSRFGDKFRDALRRRFTKGYAKGQKTIKQTLSTAALNFEQELKTADADAVLILAHAQDLGLRSGNLDAVDA